jgi:hypothetical protein
MREDEFRYKINRFPTLEHLVHAGIMREDEFRYKINRFPTLEHLHGARRHHEGG